MVLHHRFKESGRVPSVVVLLTKEDGVTMLDMTATEARQLAGWLTNAANLLEAGWMKV